MAVVSQPPTFLIKNVGPLQAVKKFRFHNSVSSFPEDLQQTIYDVYINGNREALVINSLN